MTGLMDLLNQVPSAQERFSQLQGILSLFAPPPQSGGTTGGSTGYSGGYTVSSGVPTVNMPDGDTEYKYREWDKPYYGEPKNLVTRQGITLQRGPMKSLVDIARASDYRPGIQEIGMIGQGFRSQAAQRSAAATNPYAASPGNSYHPMGLAIDAGEWSGIPALHRALLAAGWNQFDRGYEPWHYSYGVTG